jgi:hypothetical protein
MHLEITISINPEPDNQKTEEELENQSRETNKHKRE